MLITEVHGILTWERSNGTIKKWEVLQWTVIEHFWSCNSNLLNTKSCIVLGLDLQMKPDSLFSDASNLMIRPFFIWGHRNLSLERARINMGFYWNQTQSDDNWNLDLFYPQRKNDAKYRNCRTIRVAEREWFEAKLKRWSQIEFHSQITRLFIGFREEVLRATPQLLLNYACPSKQSRKTALECQKRNVSRNSSFQRFWCVFKCNRPHICF